MQFRQDLERRFARAHLADILNSTPRESRIRRLFPETVKSRILSEQPFANIGTQGTMSSLESDLPRTVLSGPCFIPRREVKNFSTLASLLSQAKIDFEEYLHSVENILSKLPTLQTIYNVGAYLDSDPNSATNLIVIFETNEYSKLLLKNDPSLIRRYGDAVLEKIASLAHRHETAIRRIHQKRQLRSRLRFVYTHDPDFAELVETELLDCLSKTYLRASRYPRNLGLPAGLSVELYYTYPFAKAITRSLFGLEDTKIILCENYRNFLPIPKTYALPTELFSLGNNCQWLGLLPPPSLDGKRDMHLGLPLYLGSSVNAEQQLAVVRNRSVLVAYLMYISSWKELQDKELLELVLSCYQDRSFGPLVKELLVTRLNRPIS